MGCTSSSDVLCAIPKQEIVPRPHNGHALQTRKEGHQVMLQFFNCVLNGSAVDCKVSAEDKKCFVLWIQSSQQLNKI
jgi:hypothetical protein